MLNMKKFKYFIIFFLHSILYVVSPLLTATFINQIVNNDYDYFAILIISMIILYIMTQIVDYFWDVFEQELRDEEYLNFIKVLNDKFDKYDYIQYNFDKNEVTQDITQNYELVKDYLSVNKIKYIIYIIKIIIVVAISIYYSIEIGIIVLLLSTISMIVPNLFADKLNKNYDSFIDSFKAIQNYTIKHFDSKEEIRFLKNQCIKSINQIFQKYKNNSKQKTRFESFYMNIISYGLINGSILLVIIISGIMAATGKIELGYIYMFQSYISQLFSPIEFILDYKTKKHGMQNIIKRYNDYSLINESTYLDDKIHNIEFKNVNIFGKLINESLHRGELLLINGGNGSGKTTLIKRIMGFDDHSNIFINNSTQLYNDILYISSENIENEFIEGYKHGSAGEVRLNHFLQYLTLDRSLYILDEPTNYIDENNKQLVIEKIKSLVDNNKIVIVISHDNVFDQINNKKVLNL